MKALSIRQPWAYLIAAGIKDIENRTWKTNYRGRFYIHAPKNNIKLDIYDLFTIKQLHLLSNTYNTEGKCLAVNCLLRRYDLSAVVGEAEIIDCIQDSTSIWADPGCWHFVLTNAVLYDKPITGIKGALNFWNYE